MQSMSLVPVFISATVALFTFGVNLAIFAYFMGRMKSSQDDLVRRVTAMELGGNGSAELRGQILEKVSNIERGVSHVPELQAQMIRMSTQFETSQASAKEQRDNLASDYHALLVAVTQREPVKSRSQAATKQ